MLCIQCAKPADSLYVEYSHGHIKLTDCAFCQQTVDKYVEFDGVLIFIDLLLLKPECYRHLVYNSFGINDNRIKKDWLGNIFHWDYLTRLWALLVAFEIYLAWAAIEQEQSQTYIQLPMTAAQYILHNLGPVQQYLFFAFQCTLDVLLLEFLTYWLINIFVNQVSFQIISRTILLAHGARLFPVLMLIWPYDSSLSVSAVQWAAGLYVVEAIRIVTNNSPLKIGLICAVVTIVKWVIVRYTMALFVTNFNWYQSVTFLVNEYRCLYIVLLYHLT
ncbi:hypothetical protein TBLA_0H00860 [Henningerozyma blattae CBS 6284]|uniref:Protein ARV n=1 Tax=Henningerozyma blattae (strain ATCC 34711 / CBS 6284 / DSM 70876 / NBRC 10599 / NRRL Y-10934 / UCD 77-7) TaxID=1071380 RepID=I2H7M3_HENB6|nr:hypothetical protein TBLA_0H00860 [Tetrapisispora blattae CBS 6284]CCH62375.1 hypothetical protein TBLA_0H00860 [Tetrapisispora blattae CBS 6284]